MSTTNLKCWSLFYLILNVLLNGVIISNGTSLSVSLEYVCFTRICVAIR